MTGPPFVPHGAADRRLLGLVAPDDWTNPEPADRYDLVVLGGGTAGLVAAAGAAGLGARVALVERALLGGDCLNVGCVPSKALLASARAAAAARDPGRGVRPAGPPEIDFAAVMERLREIRARIAVHDSAARFRDLGVDVFLGEGRFTGPAEALVDGRRLRFRRAVVATGGRPVRPAIEGLAPEDLLTNETVFSLVERPARLAVLGGGPIGCELAQAFARLGSRVILVEKAERLLRRDDPDAAARVTAALERDGVEVLLGRAAARAERGSDGTRLVLEGGGERTADAVLAAVGRLPNVEGIGLEAAGVTFDARRGVQVDDRLRTTNRRVYAAGDVVGEPLFTHVSDAQARVVVRNALFPFATRWQADAVPSCTYTDPELAQVGPTAAAARAAGREIDVWTVPFEELDRAVVDGETRGFARIVTAKGKGRILGATMVGPGAGERIGEIAVAMKGGVGLAGLADVVHPYPTVSEAWKKIGDRYQHSRLTPRIRRVLEAWFALRR